MGRLGAPCGATLFNWKHEEVGNLEAKVKTLCAVPHLLRLLKDFILFAEKEEELQKFILRQHQTRSSRRECLTGPTGSA